MKKIGLLFLSIIAILGIGMSFANPIALNFPHHCSKLKNVEIDNYRAIIETNGICENTYFNFSIPNKNELIKNVYDGCWADPGQNSRRQKLLLIDKKIDIKDITKEVVDNNAIFLGEVIASSCKSEGCCDDITNYEIIKKGNNYKLVDLDATKKAIEKITESTIRFSTIRLLTVIIELLILFAIIKIFCEKNQISNGKLILFGILPTTITLPLLWFILPLILGDGIGYIIIGEIIVTAIESIIIKYGLKISWWKAIIISLICNIISFFVLSEDYYTRYLRIGFIIPRFIFTTIEISILFIANMFQKKEKISNKRLFIVGIIISTITLPLLNYAYNNNGETKYITIVIRTILQTIILKYGLKISRGKAIILGIIINLTSYIIISIIDTLGIYCDGGFYCRDFYRRKFYGIPSLIFKS